MKRLFTPLISILITLTSFAQKDPGAVKILDRFSQTALSSPSVSMTFDMETIDQVEGTDDRISGTIILSKDRYRLELPDNILWFNGTTSWNYLPSEKEVTITRPDKNDNSFQAKPSAVFSIYKNNYKVRLLEEKSDAYVIDLYPEDLESDHVRIRLNIGKTVPDLKSIEYKYKNGINVIITIKDYDLKKVPDVNSFTFQSDKYKGVEIIDMR